MLYLTEQTTHQIIINKSRFIAILTPVTTADQFSLIIGQIKKEYPKANHYTTAYILGEDGLNQGSNDDGEPSGTAGLPILEILRAFNVTNILAVVVRYFGGIKLGAGGLIRAYASAAKDCLNEAKLYQKIKAPVYQVQFNYHLINQIENLLGLDVTYLNKDFGSIVTYTICFPSLNSEILTTIKHLLIDLKQLEDNELLIPWK